MRPAPVRSLPTGLAAGGMEGGGVSAALSRLPQLRAGSVG